MTSGSMRWVHEGRGKWDEDKTRIVGAAPEGVFDTRYRGCRPGDAVPGEWWRVEDGGRLVGYGWMDCTWGDAEILLVVEPGARGRGVGSFILDRLEEEARARGLNYLYNIVPESHPEPQRVTAWLGKRRFSAAESGRLVRRVPAQRREAP